MIMLAKNAAKTKNRVSGVSSKVSSDEQCLRGCEEHRSSEATSEVLNSKNLKMKTRERWWLQSISLRLLKTMITTSIYSLKLSN